MKTYKNHLFGICLGLAAVAYCGFVAISIVDKNKEVLTTGITPRQMWLQQKVASPLSSVFGSAKGSATMQHTGAPGATLPAAEFSSVNRSLIGAGPSAVLTYCSSAGPSRSSSALRTMAQDASVETYGGGYGPSQGALTLSSSARVSATNQHLYASTVLLHSSARAHGIVAISQEAEEAAMAQSAPRRVGTLPPPPGTNPDPSSQLPLGDVSFGFIALLMAAYIALRYYLRRKNMLKQ